MADIPAAHIRLPQRAEGVSGAEQKPGEPMPEQTAQDARTVSQEPISKETAKPN